MRELCGEGMETVPRLVLDGERAVETVVDDMHAGERELGTDLMCHAREDLHFKERAFLVFDGRARDRLEIGDGVKKSEA